MPSAVVAASVYLRLVYLSVLVAGAGRGPGGGSDGVPYRASYDTVARSGGGDLESTGGAAPWARRMRQWAMSSSSVVVPSEEDAEEQATGGVWWCGLLVRFRSTTAPPYCCSPSSTVRSSRNSTSLCLLQS
ncbi:hypothetical protein ZWY2020_021163 [Hordeum vulgare]|nr:hypothetical protein ZWY2020_021163 [Hordeum vulgare]